MTRQDAQVNFWGYGVVLIIVLVSGMYFDIKPLIIELKKVRANDLRVQAQLQSESELLQRKALLQSAVAKITLSLDRYYRANSAADMMMEVLTKLWQIGDANGLRIQSMEPLPWKTTTTLDWLEVHVIALGKFSQFVSFFSILAESSLPLIMNDFSLQMESSGLMRMEMTLGALYIASSKKSADLVSVPLKQARDPFRSENSAILTDRIEDLSVHLHAVSWRQLHVVGYLHDDPICWGLIMLPSGRTMAIDKQTRVGLEGLKVVGIDESGITLEIAGKRQKMH